MQGEREKDCMEKIKSFLFYKNGHILKAPDISKPVFELTDDEFINNRVWLITEESRSYYYGLLEEDQVEIENIIRTAKRNPQESVFPDFLFENGYIEHFRVTSSKETRKGAEQTKTASNFKAKVQAETEETRSEWSKAPNFEGMRSRSWCCLNPEHNYTYLYNSFKKNWINHFEKIKNYYGTKKTGIFMIDYPDSALCMHEKMYCNWENGMTSGDIRAPETFVEYRLSRDKLLLKFIYQYNEDIKYVIFYNGKRMEIIKTTSIPQFIKLLPWDYLVDSLRGCTIASLYGVSIPINPKGETN